MLPMGFYLLFNFNFTLSSGFSLTPKYIHRPLNKTKDKILDGNCRVVNEGEGQNMNQVRRYLPKI